MVAVTPAADYTVKINIPVPASWAATAAMRPAGGLVVRVRSPMEHAGKMSGVTVGWNPWSKFDATTETVAFSAEKTTVK